MSDTNKQLNNSTNTSQTLGISDMRIFKDNPQLVYVYKKTEKLVSAIYLLSSFISDKEPVKWQLRAEGVELLAQSFALTNRSLGEQNSAYTKFISTAIKCLSFLEVSFLGGIISEMNFNILKTEFEALIKTAEAYEQSSQSMSLISPDHFFTTPELLPNHATQNIVNKVTSNFNTKGQTVSDRLSVAKGSETVRTSELKQKDKSNRQDIIISLLTKTKDLGIKDFTLAIKGCSEKTIQRELATLISNGQIKKEGEKRWSKYSLK